MARISVRVEGEGEGGGTGGDEGKLGAWKRTPMAAVTPSCTSSHATMSARCTPSGGVQYDCEARTWASEGAQRGQGKASVTVGMRVRVAPRR